jgi:hypothetical protein
MVPEDHLLELILKGDLTITFNQRGVGRMQGTSTKHGIRLHVESDHGVVVHCSKRPIQWGMGERRAMTQKEVDTCWDEALRIYRLLKVFTPDDPRPERYQAGQRPAGSFDVVGV